MKIIIGWSEKSSYTLAKVIRTWFPYVLPSVDPCVIPAEIEAGQALSSEFATESSDSSVVVLCLTPADIDSPSIQREVAALSRRIDASRIFPILFGAAKMPIEGPLARFRCTEFRRSEVMRLVEVINKLDKSGRVAQSDLQRAFESWWSILQEKASRVLGTEVARLGADDVPSAHESEVEPSGDITLPSRHRQVDALYEAATNIVIASGRGSISLIQRHLRIGYCRAALLLERMEAAGVLGPMGRNGQRDVLVRRPKAELPLKSARMFNISNLPREA